MIDGITIGNLDGAASTPPPTSVVPENQILGKDDFLTLLVTQLRTQDPLSPMDGQEMAVQLAQFSSVEQLISLNENMELQSEKTDSMVGMLNSTLGASLMGKEVLARGDVFEVPGDGLVNFELEGPGTASLALVDANGREVATQPLGPLSGGRHEIDATALTQNLPQGTYRLQVFATDATGLNNVPAHPLVRFVVDSLRFDESGLLLTGGGVETRLGDVVEVGGAPIAPGTGSTTSPPGG